MQTYTQNSEKTGGGQVVVSTSWSPTEHRLTIRAGNTLAQIDLGRNLADAYNAVKGLRQSLASIESSIDMVRDAQADLAAGVASWPTTCPKCDHQYQTPEEYDQTTCPECGLTLDVDHEALAAGDVAPREFVGYGAVA